MSTFKIIYDPKTTNIVFERQDIKEDDKKYYNSLKDIFGMEKPLVFKIGKMPEYELTEEEKLLYKKSFMHMYNKFALDEGAITKDMFDKAEIIIDKKTK